VFRIRLVHSELQVPVGAAVIRGIRSSLTPPGLVGSAPSWIRCVQQVNSRYEAGDSLALSGEPGTGKRALLRAVHLLHNPTHGVRVLDPPAPNRVEPWHADLVDALSTPTTLLIIPHAESLDAEATALLAAELLELASDDDPDRRTRVAITSSTPDLAHDMLAATFPRTIEVPPLRHHIDDLGELVPHLLTELTGDNRLSMSEAAMAQLKRLNWPGNVAQLRDLLAQVVRRRHYGVIETDDLPPAARTSEHRRLTPIEAMERDAIVQALLDNGQKPAKAAAALGLSRATIYRKLHQFGIALPLLTESRP
jgi:transcriptional regulator of acetoin/glycerol metabolism